MLDGGLARALDRQTSGLLAAPGAVTSIEQVTHGKECDTEGSARQVKVMSPASLETPPHRREPVGGLEDVSQYDHDETSRANELQVRADRPSP